MCSGNNTTYRRRFRCHDISYRIPWPCPPSLPATSLVTHSICEVFLAQQPNYKTLNIYIKGSSKAEPWWPECLVLSLSRRKYEFYLLVEMLDPGHPEFTCNKIPVVMFSRSPSARNILNMQNRTEQVGSWFLSSIAYKLFSSTTTINNTRSPTISPSGTVSAGVQFKV